MQAEVAAMSAVILDMRARFARSAQSDQDIARNRVFERLVDKCPPDRIRIAQNMATNAITNRGASIERAVKGATAWATCATEPNPPPRAA